MTSEKLGKGYAMSEYTTECREETKAEFLGSLDEIAREGARRLLMAVLQAEVEEYIQRAKQARDERGHALVVRNGRARERTVTLGVGEVKVRAPRQSADSQDERSRVTPRRVGSGRQVGSICRATLAQDQRAASGCPGPGGDQVPQWVARERTGPRK